MGVLLAIDKTHLGERRMDKKRKGDRFNMTGCLFPSQYYQNELLLYEVLNIYFASRYSWYVQ